MTRRPRLLFGACQHIQRSSICINYRGRGNSDLRRDKGAFDVVRRNSRDALPEKVHPPEWWRRGMAVGVEGIYAVVLSSYKQHIVPTLARYVRSREKDRLGLDVSVYFQPEYLSKITHLHIAPIQ